MNHPFIIRLRRGFERLDEEVKIIQKQERYEYLSFLQSVSFYDLIDLIISACTLYPRSKDECIATLYDLSFSTINHYGLSTMRLSHRDIEDLSRAVNDIGMEVISQLEGAGFYEPETVDDDVDYLTARVYVATVKKINPFTFVVSGRTSIERKTLSDRHFQDPEVPRYLH